MIYQRRGKTYSLDEGAIRMVDTQSGQSRTFPLDDIVEVCLWTLNIESGCMIRTRTHGKLVVRCGFVMEEDYMSFVVALHVALLQGGHTPRYVQGNAVLWWGGWILLGILVFGCGVFSLQTEQSVLLAMSFWRIALLFGMLAAIASFVFSCIRAGRAVPYDPEDLLSPRKKRLVEAQHRLDEEKRDR